MELRRRAQLAPNAVGMPRPEGTVGMTLGRSVRYWWAGAVDGMGTYLAAAWGYDTPATGEFSDGLGPPTGCWAEGAQGALLLLQPAGSLYRRAPGCPRANERRDPVCCPSILWRWLAVGDTLWQ